jgi:hypothetical protein
MPRPSKTPKASTVAHAVEGLVHAITGLVDTLSGAAQEARVVGKAAKDVKVAVVGKQRGPGKGNPKLKAALKRYWARMKGKARHSRIAKMLAGRGLKAKGAPKRTSVKKAKAKRASSVKPAALPKASSGWASMSPEQKAARIARMQAGRAKVAQA